MYRYIALLRGINVGGHKKILMSNLKSLFESLGFEEVTTYIQSGNVIFSCPSAKASGGKRTEKETDLGNKISKAIESKYGFIVPILVKKASELVEIQSKCPFFDEKLKKSYFILLKEKPLNENIQITIEAAKSYPNEELLIEEDCVYIYYSKGAGKAKMGNNFFEKKLKVITTARNYRTIAKLSELASS